jgi:hypothetical protein
VVGLADSSAAAVFHAAQRFFEAPKSRFGGGCRVGLAVDGGLNLEPGFGLVIRVGANPNRRVVEAVGQCDRVHLRLPFFRLGPIPQRWV